jgi:transcriptional regulator with XRE-family HTH domain
MMRVKTKPDPEYLQEYRQRIGESIRESREKRGYSQDELAEIMEVNRSTISKIENGKFSISIDYIVKFGWYLDFDIVLLSRNKQAKQNSVAI